MNRQHTRKVRRKRKGGSHAPQGQGFQGQPQGGYNAPQQAQGQAQYGHQQQGPYNPPPQNQGPPQGQVNQQAPPQGQVHQYNGPPQGQAQAPHQRMAGGQAPFAHNAPGYRAPWEQADEMPGLFECMKEGFEGDDQAMIHCLRAWCVPCLPATDIHMVAVGDEGGQNDGVKCTALWGCCGGCMTLYHGLVTTGKLRERFGMDPGSPIMNCLAMWCCPALVLAQQHKFLRTKLRNENWGRLWNAGTKTLGPVGPQRQAMGPPRGAPMHHQGGRY